MRAFNLQEIAAESTAANQSWREFLRAASLSMGVYQLKAGQADPQQAHTEDEVYYVVCGKAGFVVDGQRLEVKSGTVIFVERLREHRFCDVTEDLTVLVFFAPPEGSHSAARAQASPGR